MTWEYTYKLFTQLNIAGEVLSCLSLFLSVFMLSAALCLRLRPATKHIVDRLSFRLMLWSMIGEICYDAVYIAVGNNPALFSDKACGVVVYLTFATMGVVNWLCTCIAINLMMTIVFWVNPVEKGNWISPLSRAYAVGLEKWYIFGSVILGLVPPMFPAMLGHFGLDPTFDTCYFTSDDRVIRRIHFIVDVYLWQSLSAIVCTICTVTVLITLFRQSRRTAKALHAGNPLNGEGVMSSANINKLNDRFYSIALRISWYPISLVVINGILTASDLYSNETDGIKTLGQGALSGIYTLLFGGRGVVLAIIGIFVDPCLRRGWQASRHKTQVPLPPHPTQAHTTVPTQVLVSEIMPSLWYAQSYVPHDQSPITAPPATPGRVSHLRWTDTRQATSRMQGPVEEVDEVDKAVGYLDPVTGPAEDQEEGGIPAARPHIERLNTDEVERLYWDVEARL